MQDFKGEKVKELFAHFCKNKYKDFNHFDKAISRIKNDFMLDEIKDTKGKKQDVYIGRENLMLDDEIIKHIKTLDEYTKFNVTHSVLISDNLAWLDKKITLGKENINLFTDDDRKFMQSFYDIKPNAKFGKKYAEFYKDGVGALEKLLQEKNGQVAGAFYRKDLEHLSGNGDIDLVWGDENFGLKHILDKHGGEFKDLASELSEAITKGKLLKDGKTANIAIKSPIKLSMGI